MDDSVFSKNLQAILDLGFAEELALEALSVSDDLEQAVDYLFSNPSTLSNPGHGIPNYSYQGPLVPPPLIPKPVLSIPPPIQPTPVLLNSKLQSSPNKPIVFQAFPPIPAKKDLQNEPNLKKNSDFSDENFSEFLAKTLKTKGYSDTDIIEITSGCCSKEEALLILGIPTWHKSKPFSEIELFLDNSQSTETVKSQLIQAGVPPAKAEVLSSEFFSVSEALQAYYDEVDASPPPYYKKPEHAMINPLLNPFSNSNSNNPKFGNLNIMTDPPDLFPNKPFVYDSYSDPEDDYGYPGYKPSQVVVLNQPTESDPIAPDSKTSYFSSLKDFRLVMTEDPSIFASFAHAEIVSSSPQALKRINTEIKTLQTSVPCDSSASIFTVFDSSCMHRVKILLSGTEDTPYAHGLFLFDVLLPGNYPNSPPKVSLVTTGQGVMRFNPNLYANGYVCLSIINTWSGRPEEQWSSSSTILQVMLSIQSLVMDNNILQKEPSFQNLPTNAAENVAYQQEVKYGNIRFAMIDMLKNPPAGFREVVLLHFKEKKNEILKTVKTWAEEMKAVRYIGNGTQNYEINNQINAMGGGAVFLSAYEELKSLLDSIRI